MIATTATPLCSVRRQGWKLGRTVQSIALVLLFSSVQAYLPGVGPLRWKTGQNVPLFLNELTSLRTQIPFDYYSLPFCSLADHAPEPETLGEMLEGEVKEHSGYK